MVTAEWWLSCIVSSLSHFLSSPSSPFLSASFSSHSHFFPLSSGIHHDSRLHCLGLAAISYDKRALKSLPRSLTSLDGIGKFSSTSLSCFPPQRFVAVHHQKWMLFPLRNLHGNIQLFGRYLISFFSLCINPAISLQALSRLPHNLTVSFCANTSLSTSSSICVYQSFVYREGLARFKSQNQLCYIYIVRYQ